MKKCRRRPEHPASETQHSPWRPGTGDANRLSGAGMGAATLTIGSARIHRKPAPRTSVRRFKTTARRGSYPAKRRGTGLS
jgi:hypothetical protein